MNDWNLQQDGFCMLRQSVPVETAERLLEVCRDAFDVDSDGVLARSSRGHVYAARNLIESIPEVTTAWQYETLLSFLRHQTYRFELCRAIRIGGACVGSRCNWPGFHGRPLSFPTPSWFYPGAFTMSSFLRRRLFLRFR